MVGWHHQLDGCEFEQVLGLGDGQGSLACCSPWGHKELDTTEHLSLFFHYQPGKILLGSEGWGSWRREGGSTSWERFCWDLSHGAHGEGPAELGKFQIR